MALKDIKMILSGLDNAGKTSILESLRRMHDYEKFLASLMPTIKINYFQRQFLNLRLNILDMGGQVKYRKLYLRHPRHFDELDSLIYLIDIQDEERYIESVNYLENVLNILDDLEIEKETHPINICFSKADGDFLLEMKEKYEDKINMLTNLITTRYPSFKFTFQYTSIYNIFSISRLISGVLHQISNHSQQFHELFSIFVKKHQLLDLCLFDDTGLIIREQSFHEEEDYLQKLKYDTIISDNLNFQGILKDESIEIYRNISVEKDFSNIQYQFSLSQIKESHWSDEHTENKKGKNFFLSVVFSTQTRNDFESEIPSLLDEIKTILVPFFE